MEDEGRVPVFTSTSDVEFSLGERAPRQVVTLYNPYPYPIQYKVLCTAPANYSVGDANGSLLAKCCKDIVIRCKTRMPAGCIDKLRVEIRKKGATELHGSRDLTLRTVAERSSQPEPGKAASSFFGMSDSVSAGSGGRSRNTSERPAPNKESSQWIYLLAAVACAVALLLPTAADPSPPSASQIPVWLHLSLPQKLVASFMLGVMSMLLLRP